MRILVHFVMTQHSQLVIFGAGGHGKVVINAALEAGVRPALAVDDAPACDCIFGVPVVATSCIDWIDFGRFEFLVALGSNELRREVFDKLMKFGGLPGTILHPSASIAPSVSIGRGSVVCAGSILSVDVRIGDNCILNTGCLVDHDCIIGSDVHICPGVQLAGNVSIGDGSTVGIGSCAIPGVRVGKNCMIGAGSVMVRSFGDGVLAFGNPCRARGFTRQP